MHFWRGSDGKIVAKVVARDPKSDPHFGKDEMGE